MIAEIVAVGTELLMGQVLNTDAQYIARRLSELGVTLHRQVVVGDNPARIREAIHTAIGRADVVITTGGLGPTADDITKETCAEADFAKGAIILENHNGTAPACIVEKDGKAVINLPGPPRELMPLFAESVAPYLARRSGAVIVSRYMRVFGMGESAVESRLHDMMENSLNPTVAPYCSTGEVQLRLTVRVAHESEAAALLDPAEREIRARLGNVVYAVTDDPEYTMEQALVKALCAAKKTMVRDDRFEDRQRLRRVGRVSRGLRHLLQRGKNAHARRKSRNAGKIRRGQPRDGA